MVKFIHSFKIFIEHLLKKATPSKPKETGCKLWMWGSVHRKGTSVDGTLVTPEGTDRAPPAATYSFPKTKLTSSCLSGAGLGVR